MRFTETALKGAWVVEPEPFADERGTFSRAYCRREFAGQGIAFDVVQSSLSFNRKAGTLRGLHYQAAPHEEDKLVSCVTGKVLDVILDLRRGSATRGRWTSVELDMESRRMLFVPRGFAHGFVSLQDATTVLYQMSEYHHAESARGIRWDDPAFSIQWPALELTMSEKDKAYPLTTGLEP